MKQQNEFEDACEYVEDVPVSAVLVPLKSKGYGSVPGLDDEELADPTELERQVMVDEWGPVLQLPVKTTRGWIQPNMHESGEVDFGAFGTVDFERGRPAFDKARYKADKMRQQLADLTIMIAIVKDRIHKKEAWLVLRYFAKGIIGPEHILDEDTRALAHLFARAKGLQRQLRELRTASRESRARKIRVFLEG